MLVGGANNLSQVITVNFIRNNKASRDLIRGKSFFAPGAKLSKGEIFSDNAIDLYSVSAETNLSARELIQYRSLVGGGPSLKTWPRCASHRLHNTSILLMKKLLSGSVLILPSEITSQKLGQPVPESNLLFELKS